MQNSTSIDSWIVTTIYALLHEDYDNDSNIDDIEAKFSLEDLVNVASIDVQSSSEDHN